MAVIHILDKHTAELIAAGEVVERPSSVVKELIENAIDAGATQITVNIEAGGKRLIEVSDNGSGIEAQYINRAFIRHATSKIEKASDLDAIHTLGFRGEALASIASVSHVELMTKTEQDEFAVCYRISGGNEEGMEPCAHGIGTTIRVMDLFYNTPARMKFLKKDASEGTFISDVVIHAVLSHPEISFKYVREGKQQFKTPGDGKLLSAAYSVLGREFARDLIAVNAEIGVYSVTGLITMPRGCRASRGMQHFYVNNRYVKDKTMQAALENAYKGTLMQGKYPGAVLMLSMPADLVDVNVHPAKTEIRFAHSNDVFEAVYHAVRSALAAPGTGEMSFSLGTLENAKSVSKTAGEAVPAEQYAAPVTAPAEPPVHTGLSAVKPVADIREEPTDSAPETDAAASQSTWFGSAVSQSAASQADLWGVDEVVLNSPAARRFQSAWANESLLDICPEEPVDSTAEPAPGKPAAETAATRSQVISAAATAEEKPDTAVGTPQEPEYAAQAETETSAAAVKPKQTSFTENGEQVFTYIGELFDTYILIQRENDICLIDKHAAHERIRFEQLSKNYGNVPRQVLMVPVIVTLSAEEHQAVVDNRELLLNIGIDAESFGTNTIAVREIPADIEPQDIENLILDLADRLHTGERDTLPEKTEWVLHSISCRGAIKGGDKTSSAELIRLAQDILSGVVPPFCPHGRPCVLKITRKELEKQFGRLV